MAVTGANTNYKITNEGGGSSVQDLGQRYVSQEYLIDVYPNIAAIGGNRLSPGLWAWGVNSFGNLGNGTITNYSSPVQVGLLTNWKQISSGSVSVAIKTDGTLWAWGRNDLGTVGNGTNGNYYSSPIQIGALTNWRQVTTAHLNVVAIKTDGTLWSWGNGGLAMIGNGSISSYSSPIQIGALTNWKSLPSNAYWSIGVIKTDGTLWTWGYNANGQLGVGVGLTANYSSPVQVGSLTNWKQVSCGQSFMMSVKTDGTLWSWGYNNRGQLGNGTTTDYSSPIQVGLLTNWKQVNCGENFWHAIKTDGTLWACGYNNSGQLGTTFTAVAYSSPVQVGALTNWKSVNAGAGQTVLAIKSDGSLWGWGTGADGRLGNQTTSSYNSPIQIGLLTNWKFASGSTQASIAISELY